MPFSFHCPYCGFKATLGFHLDDHIKKYHQEKLRGYNINDNKEIKGKNVKSGNVKKIFKLKIFKLKECTCKGNNPNCFKCEGRGYISMGYTKVQDKIENLTEPLQLIKPVNWFATTEEFIKRKSLLKRLKRKNKTKKK